MTKEVIDKTIDDYYTIKIDEMLYVYCLIKIDKILHKNKFIIRSTLKDTIEISMSLEASKQINKISPIKLGFNMKKTKEKLYQNNREMMNTQDLPVYAYAVLFIKKYYKDNNINIWNKVIPKTKDDILCDYIFLRDDIGSKYLLYKDKYNTIKNTDEIWRDIRNSNNTKIDENVYDFNIDNCSTLRIVDLNYSVGRFPILKDELLNFL